MKNLLTLLTLPALLSPATTGSYDKRTFTDATSYVPIEELPLVKFDQLNSYLNSKPRLAEVAGVSKHRTGANLSSFRVVSLSLAVASKRADAIGEAAKVLQQADRLATKCDPESYATLRCAYLSALDKVKPDAVLKPNNLVNKVVVEALEKHGQVCRPHYAFIYRTFHQVREPFVEQVDRILSQEVIELLFPEQDLRLRIRAIDLMARFAARVPRRLIREDTASIGKQLVEPCRRYVEEFGEIFLSARLDLALNDEKIPEINASREAKFDETWVRFRICAALTSDEKKTVGLIESLARQ